jgi:ribonuclease HI
VLRENPTRAADRVQLRAKRLAKPRGARRGRILAAAQTLILQLYGAEVPADWLCGWCDATVDRDGARRRAGVGGLVLDGRGRELARISQPIPERPPFEAEIAALEAVLRAAGRRRRARRIRVYTDCDALVSLWLQSRRDPRLAAVRSAARRLRRFELYRVPRRHNQAAHRLAREAALAS